MNGCPYQLSKENRASGALEQGHEPDIAPEPMKATIGTGRAYESLPQLALLENGCGDVAENSSACSTAEGIGDLWPQGHRWRSAGSG